MQIYWSKLIDVITESPEVKTFVFECPEDYTWEEGSHIHLAFEGFNAGEKPDRSLIRHMSISTLKDENTIGITTRIRQDASKFKQILNEMPIGSEAAIFKTHTNVPLKREGKNIYMLSSGVGLATFRPLALDYLNNSENVAKIHSLNIDSSKNYLFTNIFESSADKNLTAHFVGSRSEYYEEAAKLTEDKDGLFYVVGSDEFLRQNIELLLKQGIPNHQIMLDKHEGQREKFFAN